MEQMGETRRRGERRTRSTLVDGKRRGIRGERRRKRGAEKKRRKGVGRTGPDKYRPFCSLVSLPLPSLSSSALPLSLSSPTPSIRRRLLPFPAFFFSPFRPLSALSSLWQPCGLLPPLPSFLPLPPSSPLHAPSAPLVLSSRHRLRFWREKKKRTGRTLHLADSGRPATPPPAHPPAEVRTREFCTSI